jgi:GPI ethanolamine phosphate transferase 3 subunit O
MGDDTWLTVFSTAFHPEMSHDFDSFNVEDPHTVDNGVIANLFPLLTNSTHAHSWDLLIGHFLGVDHVDHRVGPDHLTMQAKQQQMNDVLKRVVGLLDNDTLFVVLGDHGMDRKGDHGGDGDLEISSGLWIYSKGPALSSEHPPTSDLPHKTFPGESSPHRSVQQIDLVPMLSLLLGLPIPFNNLGTVIPELFWRDRSGSEYAKALSINARQVHAYLDTYRNSSSGGELDGTWRTLGVSWPVSTGAGQKKGLRPQSIIIF